MCSIAGLLSPTPASAWSQLFNGSDGVGPCSPCVAYPKGVVRGYRFSSTFNVNFRQTARDAAGTWTALNYRSPKWIEVTDSAGLALGAANLAPDLCGQAYTYADSAHYIQTSASNAVYNQNKPFALDASGGGTSSVCNLRWTMVHEFGHSGNGLSHSGVVGSAMWPTDNRAQRPQQDEFNALNAIYGPS